MSPLDTGFELLNLSPCCTTCHCCGSYPVCKTLNSKLYQQVRAVLGFVQVYHLVFTGELDAVNIVHVLL